MSKAETHDLIRRIKEGLILSSKKMFEDKVKNNKMIAVSHNGKVIVTKASELPE